MLHNVCQKLASTCLAIASVLSRSAVRQPIPKMIITIATSHNLGDCTSVQQIEE